MSEETEECGTCHGMGIVSEEHDGGYHPVHCPKGCPDPIERARKAEAALRDTARMLSNQARTLHRVEALAVMWEGWAELRSTTRIDAFKDAAEALRTALADPEVTPDA